MNVRAKVSELFRATQRFLSIVLVIVLTSSELFNHAAGAADLARPVQIGMLNASWGPTPAMVGFRAGLVELGYQENTDFVLGVRFTQGNLSALPAAAQALVQYGVDLIFVTQESPAKAAQQTTSQIPIVFASLGNPVELGLIDSFSQPGGNITGVTDLRDELVPKYLELFQELVPTLKRVLYLYDASHGLSVAMARVFHEAAHRLAIEVVEQGVRTEAEAQAALARLRRGDVDGLIPGGTPALNIPGFVLEATAHQAIPSMFNAAFWAESGALASYGPDYHESGRQAARLVDKIIKGTDPADIPVEVNSKIKFTINLKVAKALGLKIAPEVLYRADQIIR